MRKISALVELDSYTPNQLLDKLLETLDVKSDAALARTLTVPPSTISKIRHKQVAFNSSLLLMVHELTGVSIRELRNLLGDTQNKYWLGDSELHLDSGCGADQPGYLPRRQKNVTNGTRQM